MVRVKGLEPPHLAVLEPKSSASTSSATPANNICKTVAIEYDEIFKFQYIITTIMILTQILVLIWQNIH